MAGYLRDFDWSIPLTLGNQKFPTTTMGIEEPDGTVKKRQVFVDSKGNYYGVENGMPIPVMMQHNLDEVVVTPSKEVKRGLLSDAFNKYLTMSNDKTKVNNAPHREYNPHLKDAAVRGAKDYALWDKQHPNAAAWRDVVTAAPFGVIAAPFMDGVASTALGQGITRGLGFFADAVKYSRLFPWIDAAATSLSGAKGLQDIQNGTFTPETALDVTPLAQVAKPMYKTAKSSVDLGRSVFDGKSVSARFNAAGASDGNIFGERLSSFEGFKEDPLQMHYKRAKAKGYDTSNIKIFDLSESIDENTEFINQLSKQLGLPPKETLKEVLQYLDTNGHGAAFKGTKNIVHDGKAPNPNAIISHEVDHVLHVPDEPLPDNIFYPRIKNLYGDYFIRDNNTEVSARGSQLHDYFGHTGKEPLTEEELQYARDHYSKDTGINNNITDLLQSTKDLNALAKWMTKYSTGIVPFAIINSNKQKK